MKILCSVYAESAGRIALLRQMTCKLISLSAALLVVGSLNAQLVIEGNVSVDCDCIADGESGNFLDISVSGGLPPYTYEWTLNGSEVICSPRVDFSALDDTGCPLSAPGEECSPQQDCSIPSDAINAQNFFIGDALLTVGPPIANGGACIDENLINDSTLDGFFSIRTGVSQLGNPGPAANVTRTWNFSNPVCDLQILLNDIDGEDAIIVRGKLNGTIIPLTTDDFILTNTTPDVACPEFTGGNTWESQNGCSSADNTDRGGILITFPSCLDEIEFIYYDYTGGASAGGSYAVGFSNICAADLQCIAGGLYQVEVTDANGVSETAEFLVEESNDPVNIICPDDITTTTAPGACDAVVSWTPPVLQNGCPASSLMCTHDPGDTFPVGTTNVSCTAIDDFGAESTCDFDVTVNYGGATPTLICPANITVNADAGSCTATSVDWTPPTLSNDCALTTLTGNFQPGDDFPTGTTVVTYVGSDSAGNSYECTFNITVNNTGVPLILNCPDDITLNVDAGACDITATWIPPTPDPTCDAVVTSSSNNPGDTFPIGTTTVEYVVTDSNGNSNTCSFDVTINYDGGATPTLVCPADISVDADAGSCTATSVTWDPPTLSNGCDVLTLTSNFDPGDNFPTGTTTVTYTATDSGNNVFECSFDVTVTNTGVPLIINCPSDITITAEAGECDAAVSWTPPSPDPNCDAIITSSSHSPGEVFPAGTTTVTYIVTDSNGSTNTCSFDITVNYDVNPTLVCPADISVDAQVGECFASATWTPPTLSNDCDLGTLTSNFDPGDNFPAGTTTVTYTGTTDGGLVFECSFDVTVVNDEQTIVLECPDDISIVAAAGQCDATATWTPPIPNAECGAVITGSSHVPGDVFSIGTTTVIYTAEDQTGNVFECSFDVTVTYNVIPNLICPSNITFDAAAGSCVANVGWTPPTLDNGCELITLTSNFEPGDNFPTGTTTVTYTGIDSGGNVFECSFDVTIINTGVPLILNCPNDINLTADAGACTATATWTPPIADPNCDAVITSSTNNPGEAFPVGTTTVTYIVTDGNGTTNTCSFDITVSYDETPTLVCPNNISVNANIGSCTATSVSWDPPTLDNGCTLATLSSNFEPGDDFPTGTTTVTYTVTDEGGNAFECSFDVTVVNTGVPLILNCPDDITLTAVAGQCAAAVAWTPPTPDPTCNAVITSSTHEPGDVFQIGTTTVTYVVTDGNGITNECSFDITINYDVTPTLVCPDNIDIEADAGSCLSTNVTWIPPTLDNGCSLVTLTSDYQSGDDFPTGTTTVTYTGTDAGGTTFECSFDVIVTNTDVPLILNCPSDITVAAGGCDAEVTWTPPTPDPNCDAVITGSSHEPGDDFPIGTTTVTYTVTDGSGNSSICSFDVTITFGEDPTLVCPNDIAVNADAGSCTATAVNWDPPTLSNGCSLIELTSDFQPGDNFPTGTTTVTYTGVDANDNVFECSFDVTVNNTGVPLILNCPSGVELTLQPGACETAVSWTPPTPDPNCDVVTITGSHEPGDIFPAGTTTVTYVVTDGSGATNECSFDITLNFNENPTLDCPDNISINAPVGSCVTPVSWTPPTLSNGCDLGILTSNFEPGDNFPAGTTTVTYTATNPGGLVFECSFDVTVINDAQTTVLECPDDISLVATAGSCEAVGTWIPPVPDANCGAVITGSTHVPGDAFEIGTTTVTYTAEDQTGNVFTCSFNVTVTYESNPDLVCPNDITATADAGSCTATSVSWTPPTLSNDCELTTLTSDYEPGDDFPTGTTTVTYTGMDAGGNVFTCNFDVTVINNGPPLIVNCPNDITIITAPGQCGATASWLPPTVDENCDAVITSISHQSGDVFSVGTTTVTYIATDGNGNEAECSFDITVQYDQTPSLVCPQNITLTAAPGACAAALTWVPPTLSNDCDLFTLTSNYEPGDVFPLGVTTIIYTATDAAGNTFECDFDITVNGDVDPFALNCPNNINLTAAPGACDAIATWTPPMIDENCGFIISSSSHEPGDAFPAGTTTVVYIAVNSNGDEISCSFDVNVAYDIIPTLECPQDITVNAQPGACAAEVTWELPTLSNDCGLLTATANYEPGDALPIGITTITYTAEDFGGNVFECSFDVTVIGDNQSSPLICPDDVTQSVTPGQCETAVTWEPPVPDPNCGITITGSTHDPGNIFPIGTTTVTYFAADEDGNTVTCSFDVTVTYSDNPILVCPEDITVDAIEGTCSAPVTWAPPLFSSTCGLATLTGDYDPGDSFPLGTTTVTYIGIDGGGNEFTCSFNVTVNPNGDPVILNCPNDINVVGAFGACEATATWTPPTVDENCDAIITSISHQPGDVFPAGTTTVTYIATDSDGNELVCSFDVNVEYNIEPTLQCPNDITVNAQPGACTASATWELPTLSNDCGLSSVLSNYNPGDPIPIGTTIVTYTATNFGGDVFECSFNVVVIGDNQASPLVCPDDITVSVADGECETAVTWTPPVPDPNCGITITDSTHEPGDIFDIGTTTVTYTAADDNGNEIECSFDILVTYANTPELVCPSDITVDAIEGSCTSSVTWSVPIFSSTCGLEELEGNYQPGDDFPIGITTVTYTGTDEGGNVFTCSFNVTVNSTSPPVFLSCPDDITVTAVSGECDASATWVLPVLDENCNAIITSSSHAPGDLFLAGTTTVTYTATNEAGFEATCSFDVTVTFDAGTTDLLCPLDITVNAIPGECTTSVTWAPPTLNNGCTLANLASNYQPGDQFAAGTTTVTYTGTDASGAIFECSFDITVNNDDGLSVFDCPNDITIPLGAGQCQASVLWTPPMPDENCGVTIISNTHEPGDIFDIGTTTVVYVAVDGAGNTFECSFDVTLTYSEFPDLLCPNDITLNANAGTCTASAVWTPPTLDNGCELSTLVSNYEPGDLFPTGTTTVTYTGTDAGGNIFECSFDVTIINNGAPIILSCPDNIDLIVDTANGLCDAIANWEPPILDENCDVVSVVSSHNSGDPFPIGVTTVTYTVTDGSGNSSTCSFDVLVGYDFVPSLVCPPDITMDADPSSCLTSVSWELPILDNGCGVATYISNYEPGDNFPAGTTTVTYTGIDSGGNEFECTFDVTVISDGNIEVWDCPENISGINPAQGACEASVTWEPPVPDSNCGIVSVESNYQPGDIFPVGTTTVIYTATDGAGNTFECAFDVTVEDTEPIVEIICQDDIINIFTTEGACDAPVVWGPPTVIDNCAALVTITSTHNSGDIFPIGTTTVTYTATDPGGAMASCSFEVIVTDKEVPVIECPEDIMVNNDPGQCGASATWQIPNATDNCGATVSSDYQPGDFFSVGSTIVTYTATDDAGNSVECTFTVTVRDVEPPVVQICPENIVVSADPGECGAIVDWSVPIVVDNCQAASVGSTHVPGSFFPIGSTFILYGVLDESGNANVCTFTITVVDEEAPTMACPADITIFTDPGQCNAVVEWAVPEPFDNCEASISSSSHNPGDAFPVGTTTVTYTASDPTGAEISCSFDVIVIDKEVPTITCPDDITVNNNPGQCFASVSWSAPTANDNCGVTETSSTHEPGSLFPVGMTTVEYTITDEEGNTTVCSFIVTVNDNEIPQVLECPTDIVVTTDPGTCSAAVTWNPPTTVDNCSSIIAGSTHSPGALFPLGTTTVLYGILDASGNGTTCVFTVTVVDEEPPTMECPADITVSTDAGNCDAVVNWTIPTPFDNCGAAIISSSHEPGDVFPVGTTTVSYTAEDITGEQVSCSFDINVIDTEPPTIVCPDDIIATNDPGECGGTVNWTLPSISDNCPGVDISISHFPGDFFPVGNTLVTYTLTDGDGNVTECNFTVTVNDIEPPTVTGCPDDIVVPNDPGDCSAVVTWEPPTFSDNCGVLSVESKPSPGSLFPIGTTNVLYEAIDAAGNITTCMFTVTVEDTEDPMLTCPADITVSNDDGACGATVNWTPPIPIDNCGAEITGNTHSPGDFFPLGTTTVTYTTVNSEGVELTCSFDITVEDREDPVLTCPDDMSVPFDNDACDAAVSWDVIVSDNCTAEITSNTHSSGDTFPFGTTTVTYTAEDEFGNTAMCSFDVTVEDNEDPVILNCPEDLEVDGPPGECEGPVIIPTPQFGIDFNDCQENTVIVNDYNGTANASDIYPVGTTVITWTVTDPAGNSVTCEQTIVVIATDFTDDVAFFTDKDVFVGAEFDNADFNESDSIIIFDPGVPPNTVVNTVILDFFFRPEGNSCERDVEVEVTDPAGTVFPIFAAQTGGCNGNDAGFQFLLPVASVPTAASGGGTWKLRFRDTEDQNPISAGSPDGQAVPPGTEFSVRFGRITYDITITPDCEGDDGGGFNEDDSPTALPVELMYFKGTEEDCEAILSWGTASEINVSHFEIQRSYDGATFSTIDRVDALGGEGVAVDYTYTDTQLTLTNYYRLKIVDNDGRVEYSQIFTIQADCAGGVSISDIFPNPTVNQLINIQFNSNMDHETAKVVVRDMLGRTMMEVPMTIFLGANLITVDPTRLPAAQYVLVIEGADWRSSPARFIKLD